MIENNSNFSVNQWTGSQTMQRLLVDTNGNVGIGTTTPTGALHVVASSSSGVSTNFPGGNMAIFESERPGTAGNSYGIQVGKWGTYAVYMGINKNTASGAIPANAAYMGTYSKTYPLVLGQNIGSGDAATADLTIDNGKIGVGTTSPISTFSVKGSVGVNPFTIASSSNDTLLTVLQSGNVGIGTATPGSKLEVAGNVTITGGTLVLPNMALDEAGGSSLSQIRARNSLPLAFNTNNTVQAVITVAGSFGIGTTTPSAKLQITGTAGASDLFAISSSTNDRMLSVNSDGNLTINALNVNGAVYSNNGVLTNVNPSSQAYKNNITETNLNTDALLGLQLSHTIGIIMDKRTLV